MADKTEIITSPKQGLWLSARKYKGLLNKLTQKQISSAIKGTEISKHAKVSPAIVPIIASPGNYQCDLMFTDYAKFNGGRGIIINLIHTESRYLYSELIKTKSEVVHYLTKIIPTLSPPMTSLHVDAGTEFVNKTLKDFLSKRNINLDIANKSATINYSLGIVERVNKTVRDLIERFISTSGRSGLTKYKFSDVYDDLIHNYNTSPHSMSNETPERLRESYIHPEKKANADMIINLTTPKIDKQEEIKKKIKERFPLNSHVRILSNTKLNYEKGSVAKFGDSVHKVIGYAGFHVKVEVDGVAKSYLYHALTSATKPKLITKSVQKESKDSKRALKQLKTEKSIVKKEKREDTSKQNIIEAPRTRKKTTRMDL